MPEAGLPVPAAISCGHGPLQQEARSADRAGRQATGGEPGHQRTHVGLPGLQRETIRADLQQPVRTQDQQPVNSLPRNRLVKGQRSSICQSVETTELEGSGRTALGCFGPI